jgi:PII-like signaling protein
MHSGRVVFAQLMDHFPSYEFHKCVARYGGNYKFRGFSCVDQFLCLAFAQLTFRESLRDIEACLRSVQSKLYHMGFRGKVSRSTLADANESHDWRIYADFAQVLIHIARPMYASESLGFDLDNTVYALDSTTIDLCLSVFPWARFRARKAAIKLHTLLDLRGPIPTFIEVSEGKLHDIAGATVYQGILGYGAKGHQHKATFFHPTRDLPIMISVIDTADKISAAAEVIEDILEDGLIVTSDAEIVRLVRSSKATEAADATRIPS